MNQTKFRVDVKTGSVEGPADYMNSESFRETARKINDGSHVLIGAAPVGTPVDALICTILQTDYAAWLGMRAFSVRA